MIENFGKNVARLRKKYNMTQTELAEKIGIDKRTVSKIELGVNYPTFKNLEKISQIFNASPMELFLSEEERVLSNVPDHIMEYFKGGSEIVAALKEMVALQKECLNIMKQSR